MRICFVCLGNVCRSPTAAAIALHLLREQPLYHRFIVDSAGLGDWNVGLPPDSRSQAMAEKHGILLHGVARQFSEEDFDKYDLIIALDTEIAQRLQQMTTDTLNISKVHLLREFDVSTDDGLDVPDPYYGGTDGFELVYGIIERSCRGLLTKMVNEKLAQTKFGGVGLGTFPFSNVFGRVTEDEAARITNIFLEQGGKYIQTAPYYEGVDLLMGRILRDVPRENFILSTLCVKDRSSNLSGRYKSVISQCEDSLSKLGIDYIDIYLTSTPEATDAPFSETIQAMLDLKTQGKVREIGVCNVTLSQLLEYNFSGQVEYVQNRFSIVDQSADRQVREYCSSNNIGLIPYNVIEWGLLTSKLLQSWVLREGDLRTRVLPVFKEESVTVLRDWVNQYLKPIAEQNNSSIEALAIHWVLSQPGVTVCPVGATKVEHILSSLKARELRGRGDIISQMDNAYKHLEQTIQKLYGKEVNEFLRNSYGTW